jgi:hypothetical protein
MSVRPISQGEEEQSVGGAMTGWLMSIGASQGLLTHLRFHNIPVSQRWASTTLQRITLYGGLIGGAAVGGALGVYFYGDAQLRRLSR